MIRWCYAPNIPCPCKGCGKRTADPPCHETCEGYLAFRKGVDAYNEWVRDQAVKEELGKPLKGGKRKPFKKKR